MNRIFCALTIVAALTAQSALAAGGEHGPNGDQAKAKSSQQQTWTSQDGQQNEQWQEGRSFSYEPAIEEETMPQDGQTSWEVYRNNMRWDPKIIGSYGKRPASDKAIGNY